MEILLVEADAERRRAYTAALQKIAPVTECATETETLRAARSGRFNLVIIGGFGARSGGSIDIAAQLTAFRRTASGRGPDVFLIVDESSEDLAISALRSGVSNYFKAPVCPAELAAAARSLEQLCPLVTSAESCRIVGESSRMLILRDHVANVARSACNVLITGETGTGKELVAQMIHERSARKHKPFVCINCAAVPDLLLESELFGYERGAFTGAVSGKDGKLRQADGGTVFFDEIGDMTLSAQAKILRAIECREVQRLGGHHDVRVDLRIVAATNQPLESLSEQNLFRKDLFYRLNVARIHLPPLRERPEDIPILLEHFAEMFGRRSGCPIRAFNTEALDLLCRHTWPGNIRELRNVVEAVYVKPRRGAVEVDDLPTALLATRGDADSGQDDRDRLVDALRVTAWNKSKAAQKLNWSRMTVYRKMAQYGIIDPQTGREPSRHATTAGTA